jgi:SHS2 domain-containing protein
MEPYRYLEHTADAEFIAYGATLDEVFENAARATFALIVEPEKVKDSVVREVCLTGTALDNLLYDWLSELLFDFEVDRLVFSRFKAKVRQEDEGYSLDGQAWGETVRPGHEVSLHVKAVTYHDLRVEKRNNIYEAQVLLDI